MSNKTDNLDNEKLYTQSDIFEIFEVIKKNIDMHKSAQSEITKKDCKSIIDINFRFLK